MAFVEVVLHIKVKDKLCCRCCGSAGLAHHRVCIKVRMPTLRDQFSKLKSQGWCDPSV